MNESDNNSQNHNGNHTGTLPTSASDDLRERLWAYEDFSSATQEQSPFNVAGAFASLGFIGAAIRRSRRFWGVWAIIGLIVGLGIYVKYPVSYQATASILIKNDPGEDAVSAIQTQLSIAESRTVAGNTLKELGLSQSISSFQAAYTVTVVTDEVLSLTVSAPTETGAVDRTNALAAQYLAFRASMLRNQQQQEIASLDQQVPAAQQHIASLQNQISKLQSQSNGSSAKLTSLQKQLTTANDSLGTLEETVVGEKSQTQSTTASMIDGSQVLDSASLMHHSKIKDLLVYVLSGLIGGLAIGIGFVVVRELITDRLRRRDDIAAAIGGPIRLSVGSVKKGRLPATPRARAARVRDLRRIAAHLRNSVPRKERGGTALAVITVDNEQSIAPAVAALATSCAGDGLQVVVADLTKDAPVARRLGADRPGVQSVRPRDAELIVFVPEADDITPSGPVRPGGDRWLASTPSEALLSATRSADLLVTVADPDAAIGADHLATWATDAVVVVTAGRTHSARAYAVGEMLQLARLRVVSGVVTDADKTDHSLGLVTPEISPPSPNGGLPGAVFR